MALTSETAICAFGSSTAPSSTTVRLRQISRSPFSGLMMTSKFSSVSYCFCSAWRKTSSSTPIIVLLSMFFSSLNSAKLLIRLRLSIVSFILFLVYASVPRGFFSSACRIASRSGGCFLSEGRSKPAYRPSAAFASHLRPASGFCPAPGLPSQPVFAVCVAGRRPI
ncbi:unknown [Alistipes finegoldii CAG:68]|nr:unknown [Alistipes finegoldii CAG:68]